MAPWGKIVFSLDDYLRRRSFVPWPSWQYLLLEWPLLIAGFGFLAGAHSAGKTAEHENVALAKVTGKDMSNHAYPQYFFSVKGNPYRGESPAWRNEPAVGSFVAVYYDNSNPSINSLEPFNLQASRNRDFADVFLLVGASLIMAIGISKAWMLKKRSD